MLRQNGFQVGRGQTFVFVKYKKSKDGNDFEILPSEKLITSAVKYKLGEIRKHRTNAEKKASRVEEREILEEEPAKTIEKKPDGQHREDIEKMRPLRDQMIAAKDEYYKKKSESARLKIVKQIISSLEGQGNVFVQRVNGQLTKLADEEKVDWIRSMFNSNKTTWDGRTSAEIKRTKDNKTANGRVRFTSSDDEQINTFVSEMEAAGWTLENIPLSEWKKFGTKLGREVESIKGRVRNTVVTESGETVTVAHAILQDRKLAKKYHSQAELKPADFLCEEAQVLECMDHNYSRDYTHLHTDVVPGCKGAIGPRLHQAAAVLSSGKRPSESMITQDGTKRSKIDASHLCKRACCINPDHITWESHKANMRRNSCIGRIRLKIGNKVIMGDTNECSCVPRCLDYAEVAI